MEAVDKVNVKVLLILQYKNCWTFKQGMQKMGYHRWATLSWPPGQQITATFCMEGCGGREQQQDQK